MYVCVCLLITPTIYIYIDTLYILNIIQKASMIIYDSEYKRICHIVICLSIYYFTLHYIVLHYIILYYVILYFSLYI